MLKNNVYRFFKLSNNKKSLFIKSLTLMLFIRISLTMLPFSKIKKISKIFSRMNNNKKNNLSIEDIIWSIHIVSNYVPRATCLTQAITAQILLYRHDHFSKLKIGVIKKDNFEAHAWLEINNKIILGESEEKYVPLLDLDN